MNSSIKAWWPREPKPGNYGDILTPYLIKKITGDAPQYVNKEFSIYEKNLLAVGSTIGFANKNVIVWGTGIMSAGVNPDPNADYRAVRGPITRNKILECGGSCPSIYGDPGLLMPLFYNPVISPHYRIGIIPHYVDYENVKSDYIGMSDIKIINLINGNIEQVIDEILDCELIVSSSLHGIITAHAYGIPATWVNFSNKILGDGIKYLDYFKSVNIESRRVTISEPLNYKQLLNLPYVGGIDFDSKPLLDAFPHDIISK